MLLNSSTLLLSSLELCKTSQHGKHRKQHSGCMAIYSDSSLQLLACSDISTDSGNFVKTRRVSSYPCLHHAASEKLPRAALDGDVVAGLLPCMYISISC